jgi:hypothetical protein
MKQHALRVTSGVLVVVRPLMPDASVRLLWSYHELVDADQS